MASLASQETLGLKALWVCKVLKVYLASLARMAPVGFQAHLESLVILVSQDYKDLQDLKELQGSRVPLGGLGCLGTV